MEGVLARLGADGRCFRRGFFGGSPGRFESPGESVVFEAVDRFELDSKRGLCVFSGV